MTIEITTMADKQAFWKDQLPAFEKNYWLPNLFEFLKFDMDLGNYVLKNVNTSFNAEQFDDSAFDNEAQHAYELVNTAWSMWIKAVSHMRKQLEGCVVVPSNSVTLTCEQLLTVLQYGAPDLHVERTEYSEEQMETEMSIVWLEDGHSGKGYYAYYTELPEEGSINIDLMEEAARGGK